MSLTIAHVVTRAGEGGSAANLNHFMAWQRDAGHKVHLVGGQIGGQYEPPDGIRVTSVPSLVPEPRPVGDWAALTALRRVLSTMRPDVVHTHQSKAGVLGRLAARRGRSLVMHSVHMASFGPGYGRRSVAFLQLERMVARRTDIFVSVGDEIRDRYVAAGVGTADRHRVIRSPVDIDRFAAVRSRRDAMGRVQRADRDRPDTNVVIAVGILEARKRHDLLITRLQPLLQTGAVRLRIAGEGRELATLVRLTRALGVERSVELLGHVPHVEDVFADADVLVLTSATEGVPQVVIQAFAAGVPVVATRCEGLREVPGAPIRIVDRDGRGLADAVSAVLSAPPRPIDLAGLDPWRPTHVEARIERLHAEIAALHRGRDQVA